MRLAVVSSSDVVLLGSAILAVFFLMCGVFLFAWWVTRREASLSIYSGMPLRRATDLSYSSMEKVLRFVYDMHQYDNRIFQMKKAAVCRETGRIFLDCITWYDVIKVNWSFLQKRYPGHYVSWGSLTEEQKQAIRNMHDSLEGFQTQFSSTNPSPRMIESEFAFEKPGPLYVDIQTGVLLGWKCVPGTELEVLIVQKPTHIITPTLPKD